MYNCTSRTPEAYDCSTSALGAEEPGGQPYSPCVGCQGETAHGGAREACTVSPGCLQSNLGEAGKAAITRKVKPANRIPRLAEPRRGSASLTPRALSVRPSG